MKLKPSLVGVTLQRYFPKKRLVDPPPLVSKMYKKKISTILHNKINLTQKIVLYLMAEGICHKFCIEFHFDQKMFLFLSVLYLNVVFHQNITIFFQPWPIFYAVRVTTLLIKNEYVADIHIYCIGHTYIQFR